MTENSDSFTSSDDEDRTDSKKEDSGDESYV